METTYRLNTKEITMKFLESLKTLFSGQDIEIIVRPVSTSDSDQVRRKEALQKMVEESRLNAPKIDPSIDIRSLIDQMYSKDI